jgi:hypothetical protein
MISSDAIEIKGKNGNHIVVFDLKEYVNSEMDANRYSETKDDYMVTCPYCVDAYKTNSSYKETYTKYKLYVKKDLSIGHCFRCGKIFVGNDDSIDVDVPKIEEPISMRDFNLVKLNGSLWNLKLFDTFDDYDEIGYNYLINKRHHYFDKLYKLLNIKFSNHNPVIPFYFNGQLIYYQIKMAFGESKLPYFSPPISHKPAYILEHGDNKKFVVSEGTFDAIADMILFPDRTPFSILGSSITDYQITMLRTFVPEDILVYMDDTELSKKVADKISRYIDYANISIRYSDGQDPEEYLKYKISKN